MSAFELGRWSPNKRDWRCKRRRLAAIAFYGTLPLLISDNTLSAATKLPDIVIKKKQIVASKGRKGLAKRESTGARQGGVQKQVAGAGGATSAAPARNVPTNGPSEIKGYVAKEAFAGTKTNTPLVKVPQSVTVLTREALNDRNVQSLNEALNYVPGALSNIYGFDPRQDQIYIRGFSTLYDGVYRDGLRRAAAGIVIPHAEIYDLDSITILRGPSAGLYGLGNPGGIVDIESKRPLFTRYQELQVQAGNYGRYQGNFDLTGPVENTNGQWAYRLAGIVRESGIPYIMGGRDDRVTISPSLTFAPDNDTFFTLLTGYQHTKLPGTVAFYNLPNFVVTNIRYGDPAFNRAIQDEYRLGWAFQHRFSENFLIRQNFRISDATVNYGYTQVDSLATDGLTANRSSGLFYDKIDQASVDNQAEAKLRIGPTTHTVIAGLNYDHVDYYRQDGFGTVPPLNLVTMNYGAQPIPLPTLTQTVQQHQDQLGEYAQEQGEWDRLTVTLTGRHDNVMSNTTTMNATQGTTPPYVAQNNEAFSGRAGATFRIVDGVFPYVSYATTFQPNLGTTIAGAPFDPSRGDGKEAGFKTQIPHTNLHFNGAYFDINQTNVLVQDPTNIAGQVATGKVNSHGFELEAVDNIAPGTNVTASFTHLDVTITQGLSSGIPTTQTTGKKLSGIPDNAVAAFGTYTPQTSMLIGGLTIGGGVRYYGTSFADDPNTGVNKPVTLFDAVVSYDLGYLSPQLRGAHIQVNGQNIFGTYYTTCIEGFCYRGAPAQVISSLIYRW